MNAILLRPQMIYFDFLPRGKTREENVQFSRSQMNGRAACLLSFLWFAKAYRRRTQFAASAVIHGETTTVCPPSAAKCQPTHFCT